MTNSNGGAITIEGKTYNISQINSVYVDMVPMYEPGAIWFSFLFLGVICLPLGSILFLWIPLTCLSFYIACKLSFKRKYAVFFDMSSGKVSAYSSPDGAAVEKVKQDLIKRLERGVTG
jgi:hypothetical protein